MSDSKQRQPGRPAAKEPPWPCVLKPATPEARAFYAAVIQGTVAWIEVGRPDPGQKRP